MIYILGFFGLLIALGLLASLDDRPDDWDNHNP